jgi:F-type H+-transporting ATPase subunit beta
VPIDETVRGYGALVDGHHDDVPEEAFRFVGGLEEALWEMRVGVISTGKQGNCIPPIDQRGAQS